MTNRKTYRVVSQELDLVLFVKGYSLKEEQELYEKLRSKIHDEEKPIRIEEYKNFIVRKFLVDVDSFFDLISEDDDIDEMQEAVNAAYEAIVGLYPPFSLEFICTDLNSETFFGGIDKRFMKHLREKMSESPMPSTLGASSIEDLNSVEEYFYDNIVGQTDAIKAIMKALKLMASGLTHHSSFLFVGPTGVGKTEIAKLLGERFNGNFFKVNCAEYAGGHEYAKLIGSPPGYIGHTEKSLLAEKAEHSNSWVFLFDEIEKAHHKLYDFLLSLLDDGTCTDNMGQTLDFSESIFIFTSNKGITDIKRNPVGFMKDSMSQEVAETVIDEAIKRHFSPEFLNRIDGIVQFKSLTKKDVKEIARMHLEELPIKVTEPLLNYVVDHGYSREYGARNIARFIKNNISDKIADAILNRLIPNKEDEYYTPRLVKGEVKIIDTKKFSTSSV